MSIEALPRARFVVAWTRSSSSPTAGRPMWSSADAGVPVPVDARRAVPEGAVSGGVFLGVMPGNVVRPATHQVACSLVGLAPIGLVAASRSRGLARLRHRADPDLVPSPTGSTVAGTTIPWSQIRPSGFVAGLANLTRRGWP